MKRESKRKRDRTKCLACQVENQNIKIKKKRLSKRKRERSKEKGLICYSKFTWNLSCLVHCRITKWCSMLELFLGFQIKYVQKVCMNYCSTSVLAITNGLWLLFIFFSFIFYFFKGIDKKKHYMEIFGIEYN